MWRLCDLHTHTPPNEQCSDALEATDFVQSRLDLGLDLIAVTDHDHAEGIDEVARAADGTDLTVIPGVELSTDHGHVLALAPASQGAQTLRNFLTRVGAAPGTQTSLHHVLEALNGVQQDGRPYAADLVLIGAHVDQQGSMLASNQTLNIDGQLRLAEQMHALEVSSDDVLNDWVRNGVKQGPHFTLLRGSDCHDPADARLRATWIYLPEVTAPALQHALAIPESSVSLDPSPPTPPRFTIESVEFTGGYHDGLRFDFCPRANAVIGPPNAGKSLVVDALKFVFGLRSDLDEVEQISDARMTSCLPRDTVVEVRVRTPEGSMPLTRTVGSATPPEAPFHPIIFSQTELTRRAIASSPSIALLDLHFAEADKHKRAVRSAALEVKQLFDRLLEKSERAQTLRSSVGNPVDGLSATRTQFDELAGAESVAKLATGATSTKAWRERVEQAVSDWKEHASITDLEVPEAPSLAAEASSLTAFTPKAEVDQAINDAKARAREAVKAAADAILSKLNGQVQDFDLAQAEIEQQLAEAGFTRGSELEQRLQQLRTRITQLESASKDLQLLDSQIDDGLVELRDLHQKVHQARQELTRGRRNACRNVNESMRTFFARVDPAGVTTHIDALISELATGTYMRVDTQQTLRDSLDRYELLEYAVRLEQGQRSASSTDREQDRLASEALRRNRGEGLARLSCLWPGDSLDLSKHGTPPTAFGALTEGLRALAIKEISFASSDLPVVTDQPEDAVPTRAVFDSLVPTLREQRRNRQFVVVSHDANIVVSSDVERILVLQANTDGSPHIGDLFDPRVREAALEHLEGGPRAFRLRADRYGRLSAVRESD